MFCFTYSKSFFSFPALTKSTGHWTLPHLEGPQQHKHWTNHHGFCSPWSPPLIQPPKVPSSLCGSSCGRCVSHPPWNLIKSMSWGTRPSSSALLPDLVVDFLNLAATGDIGHLWFCTFRVMGGLEVVPHSRDHMQEGLSGYTLLFAVPEVIDAWLISDSSESFMWCFPPLLPLPLTNPCGSPLVSHAVY